MEKSFEEVWAEMTGKQHHAFHLKVWSALGRTSGEREANFQKFMAGQLWLKPEEAPELLFDRHGRRIPPRDIKAAVVDADRNFRFVRPEVNFTERLLRLHGALQLTDPEPFIQPEEFKRRAELTIDRLGHDRLLCNLTAGPYLPIVLPQMEIHDYGRTLEEMFLPAVGRAYEAEFPCGKFYIHRLGTLAGGVTAVKGSRHCALLATMALGPVVGLYFPTALQGYSIAACIEQMATLPDSVLLAGALEPAVALIMYSDVLVRDSCTLGLGCAALQWWGRQSLDFEAPDGDLHFGEMYMRTGGKYSGGLVVLG